MFRFAGCANDLQKPLNANEKRLKSNEENTVYGFTWYTYFNLPYLTWFFFATGSFKRRKHERLMSRKFFVKRSDQVGFDKNVENRRKTFKIIIESVRKRKGILNSFLCEWFTKAIKWEKVEKQWRKNSVYGLTWYTKSIYPTWYAFFCDRLLWTFDVAEILCTEVIKLVFDINVENQRKCL